MARVRQQPRDISHAPSDAAEVPVTVPYLSQRDNANRPSSTCNVTCVAMVLLASGVQPPLAGQLEDALFERIASPEGVRALGQVAPWAVGKVNPWTVHAMLVWVAAQWGVRLRFATTRTWAEVDAELAAGRPVILAGRFTGAGGHLVVLTERTPGGYLVHDPWGDWTTGYRDRDGEAVEYAEDDVIGVTASSGGVWAHFVAPAGS